MARAVGRTVRLFADRTLSPAALSAHLVAEARRLRDNLVRSGRAAPRWRTLVDGQAAATEAGAQRVIVYQFSRLAEAAAFALGFAIARSPLRLGAYRKSWFLVVGGRRWTGDLADIPSGVDVLLTNDRSYARKIEVGAMRMRVPPGVVEATRQVVQRAFVTLSCEVTYVSLPGGYVLKGAGRSRRKDRRAGAPMTYPALVMRER